jgi:hypothetical protein
MVIGVVGKLVNLKSYGTDTISNSEAVKKRRAESWNNSNRFIRENGGNVVSVAHATPLRVEVAKNSSLPKTLADAGYAVSLGERITRIGGPETFTVADILWIDLPKVY